MSDENADSPPPDGHQPQPAHKALIGLTVFLIALYAGVTGYVLAHDPSGNAVGTITGTWNTLIVGVVSFWFGASVGGRAK